MGSILIAIVTLWFIIGCVWIDARHILDGNNIDHKARAYQRFAFFLLIALFSYRISIASLLLFAALFDQFLNVCIEQPLFYLGTTSRWDKFWRKKKILYKLFKLLALLTSIYLYFYDAIKTQGLC